MKRYVFGPWMPDLPPIVNQKGTTVARNVVPIGGGYGPLAGLSNVTGATALSAYARGAIGGTDFATNAYNFAGDKTKIYKVTTDGSIDISRTAGYDCGNENYWDFAVFGESCIASNFVDPMQYFNLRDFSATAKFKDLRDLPNAPAVPRARHLAVIDNFLVAGNIFDSINGLQTDAISWSTVNNPLSWPKRGTDLAVSSLSDAQRLEGSGGHINAVVAGSEVGAIFQERAVWRMEFVGGDVVFALRRVEPNRGLLIPRLAVPIGRYVFYCSEDGFYLFDYTSSKPIGKDRVNKEFLSDIDEEFFYRVSAKRDPDETRLYVLYPGQGNVNGTPNKMIIYDWVLDQFSDAEVTADVLTWFYPEGAHLDVADNPPDDPDQLEGIPDEEDPPGDESFDDRSTPVGAGVLAAYDSSNILSSFTGDNLVGRIETGDIEVHPGSRSLVTSVRPLVDATDVTVQVAGLSRRPRPDVVLTYGRAARQEDHGACSVRVDGRYHRIRVNLPSSFENAVGCDISGRPSGVK